ncbi:MAG: PGPGW domain-containing protein [Bryobacteraceae bacterium]
MSSFLRKIPEPFRTGLGFILLLMGIIGLLIPVVPQWPFLIPALVILADRFDWAKRVLEWAQCKLAKIRGVKISG